MEFPTLLTALPPPPPPPPPDSAQETVQRTLPLFLYNSLMVSENNPTFQLNLFEPRYRVLCQRIIAKQLPPLLLFVPNFQNYIPKPGDAAFLCQVTQCQPSSGGQYHIAGRLLTTRRIIELCWVEANTGGLNFALTSPLPPIPTSNYECDANALLRHLTEHQQLGYRKPHVITLLNEYTDSNYSSPLSHVLLTCNHRDWHYQQNGIVTQVSIRSSQQRLLKKLVINNHVLKNMLSNIDVARIIQEMKQVKQYHDNNIQRAKQKMVAAIQACAPQQAVSADAIAVLPPIPMYFTMAEVIRIFRHCFPQECSIEWLNSIFQEFSMYPSTISKNIGDLPSTAMYARLPLATMQIVGQYNPQESEESEEHQGSEVNPFPFIDLTEDLLQVGCEPPYIINIKQAHVVQFKAFDVNVGVAVTNVQRLLQNVTKRVRWATVRLLFIVPLPQEQGVDEHNSTQPHTRFNRLPHSVVRYIASFFKYPY